MVLKFLIFFFFYNAIDISIENISPVALPLPEIPLPEWQQVS